MRSLGRIPPPSPRRAAAISAAVLVFSFRLSTDLNTSPPVCNTCCNLLSAFKIREPLPNVRLPLDRAFAFRPFQTRFDVRRYVVFVPA